MDIFPTQHAPFGVEPVGSQQQAEEPCVREVVAGDTPACHGVQDPAVPGGESHNMGLPAPLGCAPRSVKHNEHARR